MEIFTKLFVFYLIAVGIQYTEACGGYGVRLNKLDNCAGPKQIIKVDTNSSITLSDDCMLSVNVCFETPGFKTAKEGEFTFKLKGETKAEEKNFDMCKMLKTYSSQAEKIASHLGLPSSKCPFGKMRHCISKTVPVTQFKGALSQFAGIMEFQTKLKHNNGNTCLNVVIEIYKK